MLLLESPKLLTAMGGASGLIAVLGGKSTLSPATDERRPARGWKALLLENSLSIAAVLFSMIIVAGLALLSGWAIAKLGAAWSPGSLPPAAGPGDQLAILYYAPAWLLVGLAVVVFLLGYCAARAINLNKFSLHAVYRARIIRAFLGASRTAAERTANPFTGFDPQDNVQMHELRPGLLREASFKPGGLTRLVVRLRDANADTDKASRQIYEKLSAT